MIIRPGRTNGQTDGQARHILWPIGQLNNNSNFTIQLDAKIRLLTADEYEYVERIAAKLLQ